MNAKEIFYSNWAKKVSIVWEIVWGTLLKLKTVLYIIFIASIVFIGGPLLFRFLNNLFSLPIFNFKGSLIVGISLIVLSASTYVYCIILFRKNGEGTIVTVQPAQKLVVNGLYRYTRNPIYICHIVFFFGIAFIFGHLLLFAYCILIIPFYHTKVRYFEERKLLERFGSDYEEYMKKTPRWLIWLLNE